MVCQGVKSSFPNIFLPQGKPKQLIHGLIMLQLIKALNFTEETFLITNYYFLIVAGKSKIKKKKTTKLLSL